MSAASASRPAGRERQHARAAVLGGARARDQALALEVGEDPGERLRALALGPGDRARRARSRPAQVREHEHLVRAQRARRGARRAAAAPSRSVPRRRSDTTFSLSSLPLDSPFMAAQSYAVRRIDPRAAARHDGRRARRLRVGAAARPRDPPARPADGARGRADADAGAHPAGRRPRASGCSRSSSLPVVAIAAGGSATCWSAPGRRRRAVRARDRRLDLGAPVRTAAARRERWSRCRSSRC